MQHLGDCGAARVPCGLAKCRAIAPSRSPPVSSSSCCARCSEQARMSRSRSTADLQAGSGGGEGVGSDGTKSR